MTSGSGIRWAKGRRKMTYQKSVQEWMPLAHLTLHANTPFPNPTCHFPTNLFVYWTNVSLSTPSPSFSLIHHHLSFILFPFSLFSFTIQLLSPPSPIFQGSMIHFLKHNINHKTNTTYFDNFFKHYNTSSWFLTIRLPFDSLNYYLSNLVSYETDIS